jgi:hypothetical protein
MLEHSSKRQKSFQLVFFILRASGRKSIGCSSRRKVFFKVTLTFLGGRINEVINTVKMLLN